MKNSTVMADNGIVIPQTEKIDRDEVRETYITDLLKSNQSNLRPVQFVHLFTTGAIF